MKYLSELCQAKTISLTKFQQWRYQWLITLTCVDVIRLECYTSDYHLIGDISPLNVFFPSPTPPLLYLKGIINNAWSNIHTLTAKLTTKSVRAWLKKKVHTKIKVSWKFTGVKSNLAVLYSQCQKKERKKKSGLFEELTLEMTGSKITGWKRRNRGFKQGWNSYKHKHPIHQSEHICHNIVSQTHETDYLLHISNDSNCEPARKYISLEDWVAWTGHFPMVWQTVRFN